MFDSNRQNLEFLGGPLDGHSDEFLVPLESILAVKTIPLPQYWLEEFVAQKCDFGAMQDLQVGGALEAFVVAIYELQLRDEQLRYHHATSCIAIEQQSGAHRNWLLFLEARCIPKS